MLLFKEDDKCFRMVLKSVLLLLLCAGGGVLALLAVYSIPREKMREHVFENADAYLGSYMLVDGYYSTLLDIHTDTVMLSASICPSSGNIISDVMFCPRHRLLENSDDTQLIENYTCEDENLVQYRRYPRYWHGYLVLLKPLLVFFSISDIHMIYFFVQSLLLLLIIVGLVKKNQTSLAVCFAIGILIINPMVAALNFQNASIYFILLLSILYLVWSGKLEEDYLVKKQCFVFFQVIGMSVAYFDFLTYPIVALGVPLLFLLYYSDTEDVKKRIKYVILHSVMFFVGYVGMYICKWGLATLLTEVNVFQDAYGEIMVMLNANDVEGADITIIRGIGRNLAHFMQPPYLMLIAGGVIYSVLSFARARINLNRIYRNIPSFFVGLYPFCHMVASTHSYAHYHFVYREFVVTILAVLFIILDLKKSDG